MRSEDCRRFVAAQLTTKFIPDEYPDGYFGHQLEASEKLDLQPSDQVEFFRKVITKDDSGWRGHIRVVVEKPEASEVSLSSFGWQLNQRPSAKHCRLTKSEWNLRNHFCHWTIFEKY